MRQRAKHLHILGPTNLSNLDTPLHTHTHTHTHTHIHTHTHTHTHTSTHTSTHTYRHLQTETILKNQARVGHRPVLAWFKNRA